MAFKILTNDTPVVPKTVVASVSPPPNGKKTFCYWTVADGKHGEMAKATVKSARNCGVKADFHIWTDLPEIEDATVHPCGTFDKKLYMFKFHFLKNEVSKLNYDYYVFFDADNFFVRDPGDLTRLMTDTNRVFVQMENDCDPKRSKRGDWWSCPIDKWAPLLKDMGVRADKVYNTNAGFWIVERGAVEEFYKLGVKFFDEGHKRGYKGFTEEPPLAYIGHMLQSPEDRVFEKTNWLWSSDWTGQWKDKIPTGSEWQFEDYMSGEKKMVNPSIVHAMRSKDAMISWYKGDKLEKFEGGYWSGHQMLGDTIGLVAAAHLMFVKTGKRQKVWFQESRKGILDYFDGVDWVPRESIPNAVNAGVDPSREEWDNMNGVKRFYKWMDPSLTNPKSFDIHMNGGRIHGEKLIGLITHANTQGDIPNHVVDEMVSEARKKYPEHKIVAIGNMDNKYVPEGVIDMRQENGDIKWIVDMVRKLDLLIAPQTGPCFIAAGYRIPMWVYRSKEAFWDNVLNYDTYKVERWWNRLPTAQNSNNIEKVKVKNIEYFARVGTWDHSILYDSCDYSVSKNINFSPDTCIIDIGGHVGGFSKMVATHYPNVHVYTFEPDPENFKILKMNVDGIPNISIFNAGVGHSDCFGNMEFPHTNNTGMNRFKEGNGKVKILSPTSLFKLIKHRHIGILKIDCEGGEWGFIDKLTAEERSRINEIQGEIHTDLFRNYEPYKDYPSYKEDFVRKLMREKLPEFYVFLDSCRVIKAYNKESFL